MPRPLRIALIVVAVPLSLLLLAVLALLLLANIDGGRRLIEATTARLTHQGVLLQGLEGRFPDQLQLKQLRLSDPQGQWLEVDDAQLNWSPLRLLARKAQIDRLHVAQVILARAPAYAPSKRPSSGGLWLHSLALEQLDIERLDLGAPLAGSDVVVHLQGSARLGSLQQGSLQLSAQRLDSVASTYQASAQFDPSQVQAQVDLEEGSGGPLAHLIHLPGLGALSVHLRMSGPRSAVVTQLEARAAILQAHAQGTLDLKNAAGAFEVSATTQAMTLRPGYSWQQLSLQGQWQGPLHDPSASAHVTAAGLVIPGLAVDAVRADLHSEHAKLILDANLDGTSLPAPASDVLHSAPLQLHSELTLNDPSWPLQLSLSHPLLSARGQMKFGKKDAGTLGVQFKDLRPVSAIIGLQLEGQGELTAQMQGSGSTQQILVSSALDVSGGAAPLATLLSPRAKVTGELRIHDGALTLQNSEVTSANVRATAHGELLGGLGLSWTLTAPKLAVLSPAVQGHLSASGQVLGNAPQLSIVADANAELSVNGSSPGALRLRVNARGVPRQPVGNIELSGTLDEAPLQFVADVQRLANGEFAARIERAEWKSAHAEGQLQIDAQAHSPSGHLALKVAQLSDLNRLSGLALAGALQATADFKGDDARNRAQVNLTASNLAIAGQQIQQLQVQGEIREPLSHPTVELQLAAHAQAAGVDTDINASASGAFDQLALSVKIVTAGDASTAAQLQASATLALAQQQLQLQSLQTTYRKQTVQLLAPAHISFGNVLSVDQLKLGVGQAVLQLQGQVLPALDLHAQLNNVTSALLRAELPGVDTNGHIDVDAQLAGTVQQPTGKITLVGEGFQARSGAARGLPSTDIHATAQLNGTAAQLDAQLTAGEKLKLQVSGQLPFARTGTLAVALHGSFSLDMLNPILEARGQRLLGEARIDADVGGTWAAPSARGTLALDKGDLQDYPRGVHLRAISAQLLADGTQITLKEFTAQAGTGSIKMAGTIGLGTSTVPIDLTLSARKAQPLASDLLTATVDMDVKLSGKWRQEVTVAGTVHTDHAEINIPNALPPNVEALDVIRPGQAPAPPPSTGATTIKLDLTVDAPRAVFVRGRGLDAELGGQLHVGGTSSDPDISGGFDMRNGTVNLAGATLTFSSGRLSFNGTGIKKKIDPTLDFVATSVTTGVTSTLTIGGYADSPVITLSSTPEMPQDDILSRLLFGESVTALTPLQIAQIGAALATMSGIGGGGGFNPINAVQRKLRLDRLAFSGGSSGGTTTGATGATPQTNTGASIEAGRYVTSRVYIGGRQTTTGTTQAQVQIDLTKKLKLQTTVGTGGGTVQGATPQNDPGNSVGLAYQFEYN